MTSGTIGDGTGWCSVHVRAEPRKGAGMDGSQSGVGASPGVRVVFARAEHVSSTAPVRRGGDCAWVETCEVGSGVLCVRGIGLCGADYGNRLSVREQAQPSSSTTRRNAFFYGDQQGQGCAWLVGIACFPPWTTRGTLSSRKDRRWRMTAFLSESNKDRHEGVSRSSDPTHRR